MLTEAIHSLVDSADQILLLTGQSRARKPPDRTHPLGYGMETYFWSFVVALFVFFLGGLVAFYQGARHILTPQPIVSPAISLGVLVGIRIVRRLVLRRRLPRIQTGYPGTRHPLVVLHQGVQRSKSLWDALGGFLRGHWDRDSSARRHCVESAPYRLADGAASIAIGLLLVRVSAVLANETRSLIAGEAVAGPIMEELHRVLVADSRIDEIATMHLVPQAILMELTLRFRSELSIPALDDAIREITSTLQSVEKRDAYVYVRPGPNGDALAEANPPDVRDIAFRAD